VREYGKIRSDGFAQEFDPAARGDGRENDGIPTAVTSVEETTVAMKSTWPILLGLFAVTIAAFVYDARNEAAAAGGHASDAAAAVATR
jgi:hypothetical protein